MACCLLISYSTMGQEANDTHTDPNDTLPSIEDLMKIKVALRDEIDKNAVSVAGQKNQLLQEAPSIISVITSEEIKNYGARDISEILRMVPGFEFGTDVEQLTGLSFRGIWVHEGKALIMVNGITINDLGFANNNLIGTIPSAVIERVEIIRGPGSVIYGGYAEAVVINIITKTGANLNGIEGTLSAGAVGKDGWSKLGNLNYGYSAKNLDFSISAGYSNQPLSTRKYSDFYGNSMKLNSDNAYREYWYLIAQGKYKNFSFNYNRSNQNYVGQDGNTDILPLYNNRITENYNNYTEAVSLKQEIPLTKWVNIVPSVDVSHGNVITTALNIHSLGNGEYGFEGGTQLYRYTGRLMTNWDFKKAGQFILGGTFIRDVANVISPTGNPGLQVGPNEGDTAYNAQTDMKSILAEYTNKFDRWGVTVGGRYENTSFGDAFAPRAGVTYMYGKFNAKLLYGNAYRIPIIYQIYSRTTGYSGNIHPETSHSVEFEAGYKFSSHVSARFNVFDINITDPIKFDGLNNTYVNTGRIHSMGAEGEISLHYEHLGGFASGSFAIPGAETSSDLLTSDKKEFLGMPVFKIAGGVFYDLKRLQISPSLVYESAKKGQAGDTLNPTANTQYPAVVLLNCSITYKNIFNKIDLRLTGTNLLDEKYVLTQPYYGMHAPLPAFDRHVSLTLIAKF